MTIHNLGGLGPNFNIYPLNFLLLIFIFEQTEGKAFNTFPSVISNVLMLCSSCKSFFTETL